MQTDRPILDTPDLDWDAIDLVMLDMDGTLLDLHFDNQFWREHVPQRYAERHGLSIATAKQELYRRYQAREGTMDWYCLDYWTRELGMDIAVLKQEVEHLIAVHPNVLDFLQAVWRSGRRLVLVTNAHAKSLDLKMERTRLRGCFHAIYCAHDLGLPKEDPGFWERLRAREPFVPARTLLVDDSLAVLRSAAGYGLRYLLAVARPDSRGPERPGYEYPAIRSFGDIMPPSA